MSEHADLRTGLHAEPGMHDREWQVVNATGHRICYVQAFSEDEAIYLARSIVRAVNFHEELLAAAKHMREVQKQADWGNQATEEVWREAEEELEAAINKAEEGKS